MDWYELTPELAVLAPHCPEPTQITELRRAARQFCQDSRIWSRPFQLYTVAGIDRYPLDVPRQASGITLDWLSLDGRRMDGRNTSQFRDRAPSATCGAPREYYWYPGEDLVLNPVPDKRHIIEGAMVLQPRRGADEIPE